MHICSSLILLLVPGVLSHIQLTFPPSRYVANDITSLRQLPCGYRRPQIPFFTNLTMGQTYTITWAMPVPHNGGYKLDLLDQNETPIPSGILAEFPHDRNRVSAVVTLHSNWFCHSCVLRLTQKATENGFDYLSCADININ